MPQKEGKTGRDDQPDSHSSSSCSGAGVPESHGGYVTMQETCLGDLCLWGGVFRSEVWKGETSIVSHLGPLTDDVDTDAKADWLLRRPSSGRRGMWEG